MGENEKKFLPCPNCGAKWGSGRETGIYFGSVQNNNRDFYVGCMKCGYWTGKWYKSIDEAIKNWNTIGQGEKGTDVCPNCGGAVRAYRVKIKDKRAPNWRKGDWWYIGCEKCGNHTELYQTERGAWTMWNDGRHSK